MRRNHPANRPNLEEQGRLFRCPLCGGAGWVHAKAVAASSPPAMTDAWPLICGRCGGSGFFSRLALARLLSEWPTTMDRAFDGRCSALVYKRILMRLGYTFPELFQGQKAAKRQPKEKA